MHPPARDDSRHRRLRLHRGPHHPPTRGTWLRCSHDDPVARKGSGHPANPRGCRAPGWGAARIRRSRSHVRFRLGRSDAGIDAVLHVASPIHTGKVKDENDVIAPAREGTLRVLRAASRAGIRRLVLTSAFHSVGFGHRHDHGEFTEDDWSVIDNRGVDVYGKSKILAERAAWDFIESDASGMELVVLLPVAVMGPVIGTSVSGANHIVQASVKGEMPGYPRMYIPIVDVRDVAAAQVAAITAPDAAGKRILVANGEPAVAMKEIGAVIREHFGSAASKVPTRSIPDFVVRLAALFSAEYRPVAADLGFVKRVSDKRVREILGVHPRPSKDAVLAAAESMIGTSLL